MDRRTFLAKTGSLTARLLAAGYLLPSARLLEIAAAQSGYPYQALAARVSVAHGTLLVPSHPQYGAFNKTFNLRTALSPAIRLLCKSETAVAEAIAWARAHQVPFAVRGGGHSYEGLSNSRGLVIDMRLMNAITLDPARRTVTVGAGAALGEVYKKLAAHGLAIPAGSCPTVGVAGHTLGGGYGLLARNFGLACDNLLSVELIDANGQLLRASAAENSDLFWALRGGGTGSFGVVTKFEFQAHPVRNVSIFGLKWLVPTPAEAARLLSAWQSWIATVPKSTTVILTAAKDPKTGQLLIRCAGQSLAPLATLANTIAPLQKVGAPVLYKWQHVPFLNAVAYFAGGSEAYPENYLKAKSSYVKSPIPEPALRELMQEILVNPVFVAFDAYGGAIDDKRADETAFPHRAGNLCSIQYAAVWFDAKLTTARMAQVQKLHSVIAPHVSASAYANYCDLEIPNWAEAYWGENLPRLKEVKRKYDPENVFRHAQSVPLA